MTCHFHFRLNATLHTLLTLACFTGLAAPVWAQFETRATGPLPNESFAVATGDFNNDGKLDVAVVGDYLSIFLGNGDGTFQPAVNYAGPFYTIVVADFNNDGNLDLAVTPESYRVSVFLGNGDGTFQPPINSPTIGPSDSMAVGDFNHDHKVDIAVINNPYISILLGNGDGTFQTAINNDSFVEPQFLAVGDFNNDHLLDVAVVGSFGSSANVGLLLGNGDGTLQNSLTYPLRYTPGSVAAADFNGDGKLDLAVGGYVFFNEVTVLLGNGDGSFKPSVIYPGGGNRLIVGDFRGDGKLDLIAEPSEPGVAEFLGNGDGTFQPAKVYHSGAGYTAAAGDLNDDRKPDVVLLGSKPLAITSMLNTGVLEFSPCSALAFGTQSVKTTSKPKIVELTNTGNNSISLRLVKVSGPFEATDTCGAALGAGAVCEISATFSPERVGVATGLITIRDSASSKPEVIEMVGTGKQ